MNLRFVTRKLLRALITLILAVTFVFVILRAAGDPVLAMLPDDTSPEIVEQMRQAWGLDLPIWQQYLRYWQGALQGDLGTSIYEGRPAVDLVLERIPQTLLLTVPSFFFMLIVGVPAGIWAALRRNSGVDRVIMSISVSGYSLPNFFLGILLILIFSVQLRLLPSAGSGSAAHLVMPVLTLGTAGAGVIARFVRSSMLEVMNKHYVRAAIARGVPRRIVLTRIALPNAAIPVITIVGFMIGTLIAGSIVTETVFAWPGAGRLLLDAVSSRDLAVVQVGVMLIATSMIVTNFTVDMVYFLVDPRLRYGSGQGEGS